MAITVDGIELLIEGAGEPTLVLVHGWPDTLRLWDAAVARWREHWRCVRFTLPGFDVARPRRAPSLDAIVEFLARVVDAVSPDRPVVLLLHDWGCVFGYAYQRRHPQRVAALIGVDVGDAGSAAHRATLRWSHQLAIVGYQGWLAAAWLIGGASRALGDRMTRAMARWLRCPADPALIGAQMNYPYWLTWTGRYRLRPVDPACPMLFVWGTRKPFAFHSRAWADAIGARPGSRVQPLRTGHWVMCDDPQGFAQLVADWLAADAPHAADAAPAADGA